MNAPKLTPQQVKAALAFFKAFASFKASTPANRDAADRHLDRALAAYRKAHNLSDAYGLMDCIVHFNRTHA